MTREERVEKLKCLITCMKCEVSGKVCDENCPIQYDAGNMGEIIENLEAISEILEQEPLCDRLVREYISKVKYCDECFASTFCTINSLRNSRVPQSYCVENIKKYFESKSEDEESEG